MFTGLVQKRAQVSRVEREGASGRLAVRAPGWESARTIGESIAVNGVCLTLTRVDGDILGFDVLEETFVRTNLGDKKPGASVNLETSLRMGDTIGGHFVTGHVDGTGTVASISPVERDWILGINCDQGLSYGMVPKGSIAVDGVSLTIVELRGGFFTVHLIPHTWEVTSLSELRPGDRVNLETDMLGKFVTRAMEQYRNLPGASTSG